MLNVWKESQKEWANWRTNNWKTHVHYKSTDTKCVDLILQIILVCENSSNFELLGFHQGVSKQHKIDSTIDNPKHPKLLHNGYVPVFRNVHHHNITLPGWSRVIYQYIL